MKTLKLNDLLEDMGSYCRLVTTCETIVSGISKYQVARLVREDLKEIYDLPKGVFGFYYKVYRKRF